MIRHVHLHDIGTEANICWSDDSGHHEIWLSGPRAESILADFRSETDEDGRRELLRAVIWAGRMA